MGKYKLINNVLGWIVFAIASTVYLMTMEPTASFWDCGEFISSAYKLEVGHPPGAPFFMLTANLFTQLASDPSTVAKMVNTMSALFSGLTILFLFWSITHLARKIMVKDGEEASLGQMITVMGSGLVGALAYTFSDTFWFSAVEGEVYAYSSLFTAVVFWLILKWEAGALPPADRQQCRFVHVRLLGGRRRQPRADACRGGNVPERAHGRNRHLAEPWDQAHPVQLPVRA